MDDLHLANLERELIYDLYRYCRSSSIKRARWGGICDKDGNLNDPIIIHQTYLRAPQDIAEKLQAYFRMKNPSLEDYVFALPRDNAKIAHRPL